MKITDILSINLRYYRKIYNLSQEKFAEVLGTSLAHLNKIEQKNLRHCERDIVCRSESIASVESKIPHHGKNQSNQITGPVWPAEGFVQQSEGDNFDYSCRNRKNKKFKRT